MNHVKRDVSYFNFCTLTAGGGKVVDTVTSFQVLVNGEIEAAQVSYQVTVIRFQTMKMK